jgi:RNA polymerase sigma-54 factor
LIESEDKKNPYNDEEVRIKLDKRGYIIARRTIAKYRESLKIPVSRLRKK